LQGSAEHTYNGNKMMISRGDIWYSNYNTNHSISNTNGIVIASIAFKEKILPTKLQSVLLSEPSICSRLSERECDIAEAIIRDMIIKQDISDNFTSSYNSAIITKLIVDIMRSENKLQQSSPSLCSMTVSLIHRYFRDDISLKKIAAMLSVNPNYLGKLFLNEMGISFTTYLLTLRMDYATTLIKNEELDIKEIAFASGFQSIDYFSISFKNYFGISPTNYRKQQKEKSCSSNISM